MAVFDAVDGSDATAPIRNDILSRMKIMHTQRTPAIDVARRCKAAAWMSHVTVVEEAVRQDAFPHLILEDDVEVVDRVDFDRIFVELPTTSITFLTGLINDPCMGKCDQFTRKRKADAIAARFDGGVHAVDKHTFRITSTSAYFIPSGNVARQLLLELSAISAISHIDRDIFNASCTTHMLFPSPFRSCIALATTTDIIPSQTQLFTDRYVPVARRPRIVTSR